MSEPANHASLSDDQSLGDKKLKLAGYSYVLGDAAMVAASAAREGGAGFRGGVAGGAIWAAGGAAMAHFGNPGTEKQLELLANKLEGHLKKAGYSIPADVREQSALLRKETFWQKIGDFFYEHPSEMLNASYAIGSGFLVKSGLGQMQAGKARLLPGKGNVATDFWIGAIVGTGALIGLFAKEDPQAREKASGGTMVDKAIAYVREKPLRASSALYFVNNGFLFEKARQDWRGAAAAGAFAQKSFKPHYFSTLQLATYLFANTMLFLSPRSQIAPQLPAEGVAQLEDAAARIIAAQPPQLQQAMLQDVSHYMASQKGVGQDAPAIADMLARRITELTDQRMQQAANDVSWTGREQARMAAEPATQR